MKLYRTTPKLTAQQFACGYCEEYHSRERKEVLVEIASPPFKATLPLFSIGLNKEHESYHVRVITPACRMWEVFGTLKESRDFIRKVRKEFLTW